MGEEQGCGKTYLPEPPDIACDPARDSPVLARLAAAFPNRDVVNPRAEGAGLVPKCGGGFQIKLLHNLISVVRLKMLYNNTHPYPNNQNSPS